MISVTNHSCVQRGVLISLFFCGLSSVADLALAAQEQESSIIGQVTDASGAVLPGVTVTVSSSALLVKQMVDTTNARGEYRVIPLPIGVYSAEFSLSGFQTLRRDGIRLTAGFVARIDVALELGSVAETITVSGGSPIVDVKTTAAATQVTKAVLDSIPTGRNGLNSLLTLAAGVRTSLDFGQVSTADATFRAFGRNQNTWILMDGISTTAPFSNAAGYSNAYNYESFQEATVQTLASAAESPTSGIQVSVITKSGGNDFHGSGFLSQWAKWMQSNNIDDNLRRLGTTSPQATHLRWDRSIDLGGRIVPDRLWFYTAGRMRKDAPAIVGLFDQEGEPALNLLVQKFFVNKVTYQLSPSQQINVSNHWQSRLQDGTQSVNAFSVYPESKGIHLSWSKTGQIGWQFVKGNKLLTVQAGYWSSPAGPWPVLTDVPRQRDLVTGFNRGAEEDSNTITDYGRYDTKATLKWYAPDLFLGNHDFKVGVSVMRGWANDSTIDRGAPGNYVLQYRSGVPFQIAARNNPVDPDTQLHYTGVYGQDSWTIGRRLTLNIGARYAHDNAFLPSQCRVAAPPPFQDLYPAQCYPEVGLKIWNSVSPRVHASFDLTGDGKTVLKGGWGNFVNMRGGDDLTVINRNGDFSTIFRWRDLNGDHRFQAGEANLDPNGPDFVQRQLSINDSLVGMVPNPDQKQQGSNEYSVSLERQLAGDIGIRVTGVLSKSYNTTRVLNLRRPASSYSIPITNPDPGPDGRVGTADDTGRFITYFDFPAALAGTVNQVPTFVNDDNANGTWKSFEIAANKRLSNRWQMLVSYSGTWIDAKIGDIGGGQRGVFSSNVNPNAEIFWEDKNYEWQGLITASYVFPADIRFAANFLALSGYPWARTANFTGGKQIPSITLRVEPFGTQHLPNEYLLTLRAEKSFQLMKGHRIGVRAQVYNVTNSNNITVTVNPPRAAINTQSGANFGRPTVVEAPRVGEIGLTYSF
jgi:Carboxypeptidase regulatory-like domain